MDRHSARLLPDAPLSVTSERALFATGSPRRRSAASVVRAEGSGRLLLVFSQTSGADLANDAAIMLATSDDLGATWTEPTAIYAVPGWFCLAMGGLARIADDDIRLLLGRIRIDLSLGGTEPMTGWYIASATTRDEGRTWTEPGEEIRLFPHWTELYGASNPHRLSDGRLLWAAMGTEGRDVGWHSGVTFTGPAGDDFTPPVIIAREPGRDYSDIDVVRCGDGRFLAVVREHITRQSVQSWSSDEGRTWTPIAPTPFKGSNIKLHRLPSGTIVCAYRDEDPELRGVSLSWTTDDGASWTFGGRLYAAGEDALHEPGSVCGYPDITDLGGGRLGAVLHTYPMAGRGIELRWLELRDRS